MYILQDKPDPEIAMIGGSTRIPVATLKDEHGGISHIVQDDHCYVLVNRGALSGKYLSVSDWYPEAVEAMKTLPTLKYA